MQGQVAGELGRGKLCMAIRAGFWANCNEQP